MKYLIIGIFNVIAFYILFAFVIGNGGMVESAKKIAVIAELEQKKIENQIELESLKAKLSHIQSLTEPDHQTLVMQGKKNDNMVIFKFIEESGLEEGKFNSKNPILLNRIYLSIAFVIVMIILGNLILLVQMKRKAAV